MAGVFRKAPAATRRYWALRNLSFARTEARRAGLLLEVEHWTTVCRRQAECGAEAVGGSVSERPLDMELWRWRLRCMSRVRYFSRPLVTTSQARLAAKAARLKFWEVELAAVDAEFAERASRPQVTDCPVGMPLWRWRWVCLSRVHFFRRQRDRSGSPDRCAEAVGKVAYWEAELAAVDAEFSAWLLKRPGRSDGSASAGGEPA